VTVTAAIDRKALADAVETRLRDQLPDVEGYQGEAVDVPLADGGDGRVVPYWVLHVAPGGPTDQQDLGDTVIDLDWPFQITCAGGTEADVQALMSDVDAAIFRWRPVIAGLVCGPCKPPFGFTGIPIQLDRSVTPHRPFVPLQYVTTITKT
jgi:hypothetical protein